MNKSYTQENLFENWQLMRMFMHQEAKEFRQKNTNKYKNEVEYKKALRSHLNSKFKNDSDRLMSKQVELWGIL